MQEFIIFGLCQPQEKAPNLNFKRKGFAIASTQMMQTSEKENAQPNLQMRRYCTYTVHLCFHLITCRYISSKGKSESCIKSDLQYGEAFQRSNGSIGHTEVGLDFPEVQGKIDYYEQLLKGSGIDLGTRFEKKSASQTAEMLLAEIHKRDVALVEQRNLLQRALGDNQHLAETNASQEVELVKLRVLADNISTRLQSVPTMYRNLTLYAVFLHT